MKLPYSRALVTTGGAILVLAGVLQALSVFTVSSALAETALPRPFSSALAGAWLYLGWHQLLVAACAIGAVVRIRPWTGPVLLFCAAVLATDVVWMAVFAGVHLSTALIAAPALCFLIGGRWAETPILPAAT